MSPSRKIIALLLAASSACSGAAPTTPPVTTSDQLAGVTTSSPSPTPGITTGTTTIAADPGELLVIGDWGSGTEPEGAVAGAMSRYAVDADVAAILTTGDNFYPDDIDFLMRPYDWATASGIPFWLTWGNHDISSQEKIDDIDARFDAPRWVTRQWGAVDVITLDSNQVDSEAQRAFLVAELARTDRPTIVVFHHPAYSCSSHGDTPEVLASWLPLLDDDVVLVLNGHDHNYQRFASAGVTYVVSGGGGKTTYGIGRCEPGHPDLLAGYANFHFLVMSQDPDAITVEVIDVGGNVIDEFPVDLG